jgi:hypothetical protein
MRSRTRTPAMPSRSPRSHHGLCDGNPRVSHSGSWPSGFRCRAGSATTRQQRGSLVHDGTALGRTICIAGPFKPPTRGTSGDTFAIAVVSPRAQYSAIRFPKSGSRPKGSRCCGRFATIHSPRCSLVRNGTSQVAFRGASGNAFAIAAVPSGLVDEHRGGSMRRCLRGHSFGMDVGRSGPGAKRRAR